MNNSEIKLITDLGAQLKALPDAKDTEADQCIQQHITSQANALYKLVQVVLIQNMAIEQLREQLKTAQEKQDAPAAAPKGFLDDLKEKLFGTNSAAQGAQNPTKPQPSFQTPPGAYSSPQTNTTSAGAPSFLRQAMTVGAGVAGGMMLGNALESLLGRSSASAATPSDFNQFNSPNDLTPMSNDLPDVSNDNLTMYENNDNTPFENSSFDNFDNSNNSSDFDEFDDSDSGDSDW